MTTNLAMSNLGTNSITNNIFYPILSIFIPTFFPFFALSHRVRWWRARRCWRRILFAPRLCDRKDFCRRTFWRRGTPKITQNFGYYDWLLYTNIWISIYIYIYGYIWGISPNEGYIIGYYHKWGIHTYIYIYIWISPKMDGLQRKIP